MNGRLEQPWLREGPLPRLLQILDCNGERARVIGGAVRNALLGEPVSEFDIATTAVPREVMRRAHAAGFKTIPTGIDHGTVTVIVEGMPFEVTSLREDVETFGRKAKVAFGRDWEKDAQRRDFTINALSVSRDGTLHDPVGGLADLQARRVRFIGDPATRIAEDYLRILRFFRFHAWYGEGLPDADGLSACIAARAGLDTLSRERVRMEMMKLVMAPHAVPVIAVMSEAGLIERLFAGIALLASFSNLIKSEFATRVTPDPVRRLGALALCVSDDVARLMQRLRLSRAEQEQLRSMAEDWWRIAPDADGHAGRALLYRLGASRFTDRVLLAFARARHHAEADNPAWHWLVTLPLRWTAPVFPLRAADFIALGVQRGRPLGVALAAAEAAWIAADFPSDAVAMEAIKQAGISAVQQ